MRRDPGTRPPHARQRRPGQQGQAAGEWMVWTALVVTITLFVFLVVLPVVTREPSVAFGSR